MYFVLTESQYYNYQVKIIEGFKNCLNLVLI